MPVQLPPAFLAYAARDGAWADWLARLPRLVAQVITDWDLTADGTVMHGEVAVVVPVRTRTGDHAVLKVGFPHAEAEHEHLALRAWAGAGAVRLLQADPHRSALLLEPADPGHDLHGLPVVEACEVVAGLYGGLHRSPLPQLDRLSVHAARWTQELSGLRDAQAVPRRLVDQAIGLARSFAADPATDSALIHTDLHYANVLAAEREPWLVIDPKPLAGDPAYEVAPLLWNRWAEAVATGNLRAAVLERMFTVMDVAELDEDRVRAWVVVRELVNVLDAVRTGTAVTDPGWVTRATTIAKAVQR